MTIDEWEKETAAFLIKIGQTSAAPAPKPATKILVAGLGAGAAEV